MVHSLSDSWYSRRTRVDLGMEFGRAVREQGLDRSLEDVAKHQGVIQGRRLGAVFPTRDLGGVPVPEAPGHVLLGELLCRPISPKAVADGAFLF